MELSDLSNLYRNLCECKKKSMHVVGLRENKFDNLTIIYEAYELVIYILYNIK